jgi:hypothetical protein
MRPHQTYLQLLASQGGIGRTQQGHRLGLSNDQIDQMVKDGFLRRHGNGIVAVTGAPLTREFELMRGVLLAGHGNRAGTIAAIADITAAILHGMADYPLDPIHVVTTRRVGLQPGFVFHRTSRLPKNEIALLDGVPVTDPLRTFLDVCNTTPRRATWVFLRGLRAGHYTKKGAILRIDNESRQGRGGLAAAREVIENLTEGAEKARSGKEEEVFRWILEAGLPLPERNVYLPAAAGHKWEVDFLYRQEMGVIEVSMYDIHADPEVWEKDQRKRQDLENQGYRVITVTGRTTRDEFLETLRRFLAH